MEESQSRVVPESRHRRPVVVEGRSNHHSLGQLWMESLSLELPPELPEQGRPLKKKNPSLLIIGFPFLINSAFELNSPLPLYSCEMFLNCSSNVNQVIVNR